MRLALIACLVCASTAAAADPLGIAVGKGGYVVDRVALDVAPANDGARIAITMALRATNPATRLVEVPLDVPHGARVVALTVAHGDGRIAKATAMPAEEARMKFSEHVRRGDRDPVLVSLEDTRNGLDRLDLRVFPVIARQAATIEVVVELPLRGAASLELDPRNQTVGALEVRVAGRAVRTLHAWQRVELVAVAPAPGAGALPAHSGGALFGSAAPLVPPVVIPPPVTVACSFGGDRKIRRVVRLHLPRLSHCYTAVAQWQPALAGVVTAHFRIEASGRVSKVTSSGTLAEPRITSCVEGVFAAMEFPSSDSAAEVNYPLDFRMAE